MQRSSLVLVLLTTLALPFAASAAAQDGAAVLDNACVVALDACSASCNDLGDRAQTASCLTRCSKGAATCFGDPEVTLSSEEYLAHWGDALVFTEASACHDTTPCPPEYGSCGSWSTFQDCGEPFCGISTLCKICDEWQCTAGGPAMKQRRERFRVCFNAQMQGCTEYQFATSTGSCGC